MTDHERKHLIRALQQYEAGVSHAGDYQLWVGFGDYWRQTKDKLIRRGYLRQTASGGIQLSAKGTGFIEQIRSVAA